MQTYLCHYLPFQLIPFCFSFLQKHPADTPASYPQVQAPIMDNPAFWERLGVEPYGTDTLFFAFYYQQVFYAFSIMISFIYFVYSDSFELCSAEHLPAVFSRKRIKKAIMEIP